MRTGVSCVCHHNPKHIRMDLEEMADLRIDDLFVAAQENDYYNLIGKIEYVPKMAKDFGIRPIAMGYGMLNVFGGSRMSIVLLEHPEGFQRNKDGSHRPQGCYVNPVCVQGVKRMVDIAVERGFEGYYTDEPAPQWQCYCAACRTKFAERHNGADLATVDEQTAKAFRIQCLIDYLGDITAYCKSLKADMETSVCVVPGHRAAWSGTAAIPSMDNIGTNIYLCNKEDSVEEMTPMVRDLAGICKTSGKIHHQWLQNCGVKSGREHRVVEQGEIMIREKVDCLYVWAWHGQVGVVNERCENPELSWAKASEVLRRAKDGRA